MLVIDLFCHQSPIICHSRAPGNENCHSRIPGNKNTCPGMETLLRCSWELKLALSWCGNAEIVCIFTYVQLVCQSDSPVTVTSDLSPAEPALQRIDEVNVHSLSSKNVSRSAEWERCAREFACDSYLKTLSDACISGKQHVQSWRRMLTMLKDANTQRQPKAKKRLASALADEVLPSKPNGNCYRVCLVVIVCKIVQYNSPKIVIFLIE